MQLKILSVVLVEHVKQISAFCGFGELGNQERRIKSKSQEVENLVNLSIEIEVISWYISASFVCKCAG